MDNYIVWTSCDTVLYLVCCSIYTCSRTILFSPRVLFFLCSCYKLLIDIKTTNPHTRSNQHTNCYRKHELEKKRQYEQRVRDIEHASFTPLVMSATGGMANQATVFYKRLASNLAIKSNESYSRTVDPL